MRATSNRNRRGWVTAAMLLVVAAFVAPIPAGATSHEPDLTVDHVATYRVDPLAAEVAVEFAYVVRNRSDRLEFPAFFESLPSGAVDVEARAGSVELELTAGAPADGFSPWLVAFPRPLRPGAEIEVTLTWRMVAPPFPADALLLTPAAVAFDAYAGGTADAVSAGLIVDYPAGYERLSASVFPRTESGVRIRLADGDATPYEPVSIVLENPELLERTQIAESPSITAASATGPLWAAAVGARVQELTDELDAWFGPRDAPLEIRQRPAAVDPGLAHDLTGDAPFVSAPVAASAAEVAGSLARAWLADIDVDEMWFVDGLAGAFAAGVAPDGGVGGLATSGSAVDLDGAAAVVGPLVDQIGRDGVRAVIDVLRNGTISYPGAGTDEAPEATTWRTLLDLFENVGGADAAALFREFVVPPDDHPSLDRRRAARTDYLALAERADDWAMPPLLRVPMAAWDFDAFSDRQSEVSDTILGRDELRDRADAIELDVGTVAQDAFESAATDMAATEEILAAQAEALEAVAEAVRLVEGDRGLLARVGLLGRDPDRDLEAVIALWDDGEFARATEAAHVLTDRVEGAVGRGTLRLVIPALGAVIVWNILMWLRHRGRRSARGDEVPV